MARKHDRSKLPAKMPPVGTGVDPAIGDSRDNDARPIGAHDPSSLPRAEDDDRVMSGSLEFNDQPGSGKHLGGPSVRDMSADDHEPE